MTTPTRYRVKSAIVEVLEWTGTNISAMEAFAGVSFDYDADADGGDDRAQILTAKHSSWTPLYPGNYVVRGTTGGFFILDADDLAEKYEPAETNPFIVHPQSRVADVHGVRHTVKQEFVTWPLTVGDEEAGHAQA